MIAVWVKDLQTAGVHDGKGGRLKPCQYDELNLQLSGEAVLNSCSLPLKHQLERILPNAVDRTGPTVYKHILEQVADQSVAHTRKLTKDLDSLSLRSIPGENVMLFVKQALDIVDDIHLTILDENAVPDLNTLVLHGLHDATDECVLRWAQETAYESQL